MSECATFRELIHERLDGALAQGPARELEAHLALCAACRGFGEDLSTLLAGLAQLPEHRFPERALEEVLERTVRARPAARRAGRLAGLLRWPAVAAVAAAGIIFVLIATRPSAPDRPTPAEMAKAQQDVRMVLALTARAMNRAERAANDLVLAGKVAPALRRAPIRWHTLHPGGKS